MIYIIQATFNKSITDPLTVDAQKTIEASEYKTTIIQVPGALEIPQMAARILDTKDDIEAIVGIGCIIKGDTYHFEVVSNESARALMNLSLESPVPIINGVLTCYSVEQAEQRAFSHGSKESVTTKGIEFGEACVKMCELFA
jgi:6,7-dimethyl-8-ribityllumazine synthase